MSGTVKLSLVNDAFVDIFKEHWLLMANWVHHKLSYPKNKKQTKREKEKDMIVHQWKSTETASSGWNKLVFKAVHSKWLNAPYNWPVQVQYCIYNLLSTAMWSSSRRTHGNGNLICPLIHLAGGNPTVVGRGRFVFGKEIEWVSW